MINFTYRIIFIFIATLSLALIAWQTYYQRTFHQFSFTKLKHKRKLSELRVADLITKRKVDIEACDNVTEPLDNKRRAKFETFQDCF